MKTFRFLDFGVYQDAKSFYKSILYILNKIDKEFTIKNQLKRAALSVNLNIAEGSAKKSDKELARFLETSIASMNEVVSCLDILKDAGHISEDVYKAFEEKAESIVKQLGGFIKKIK